MMISHDDFSTCHQQDHFLHSQVLFKQTEIQSSEEPGWKKAGLMCDAEMEWHECSFHTSGAINGCQKFPLNESEIKFSFSSFSALFCILFCLLAYHFHRKLLKFERRKTASNAGMSRFSSPSCVPLNFTNFIAKIKTFSIT